MTATVSGPKVNTSKVGVVYGDTGVSDQPNVVNDLTELKTYIVGYNDAQGKKQTRVVFKIPGSPAIYVLNEKISGTRVITNATDWFNKAVADKLAKKGIDQDPKVSSEGASQV